MRSRASTRIGRKRNDRQTKRQTDDANISFFSFSSVFFSCRFFFVLSDWNKIRLFARDSMIAVFSIFSRFLCLLFRFSFFFCFSFLYSCLDVLSFPFSHQFSSLFLLSRAYALRQREWNTRRTTDSEERKRRRKNEEWKIWMRCDEKMILKRMKPMSSTSSLIFNLYFLVWNFVLSLHFSCQLHFILFFIFIFVSLASLSFLIHSIFTSFAIANHRFHLDSCVDARWW